jgi:hypothetical protein
MIVVDTHLVHCQRTELDQTQKDFYRELTEELIDNTYDGVATAVGRRPRKYAGVVMRDVYGI